MGRLEVIGVVLCTLVVGFDWFVLAHMGVLDDLSIKLFFSIIMSGEDYAE